MGNIGSTGTFEVCAVTTKTLIFFYSLGWYPVPATNQVSSRPHARPDPL